MDIEIKTHTTIFYADDDADDLDFFKEAAHGLKDTISLFELGDEMLQVLHNPPPKPSMIFLDLNMPGKSGFDILKEIKESQTFSDVPVLILTTSNSPVDISRCRNLGAKLYIRKPTTIAELRKAIHFALQIDWQNFTPSDNDFLYV
jgi:CheY-like chemotaxis protein